MTTITSIEDGQEKYKRPEKWFGVRHTQAILYFCLIWITYAMRVNLSVGIVAMTDPTASANPDIPTYDWADKSVVLSSFFWGYIIPQVFVGVLVRTHGSKWLLVLSMVTNTIACMLIPTFAAQFGSKGVMACRIIQGLSQGIVFPALHNLLGKWAPAPERSQIGTFVFSGTPFGTIVAMPITGLISASWVGWPTSFYCFGSLGIIWTIFWILFATDSPAEHKSITMEELKYIEASLPPQEDKKYPTPWKKILLSLPVWAIIVGNVGFNWGYSTLLTEIPNYMNKIMKFNMNENGFLSAAPYLVFWILCFVAGPMSDHLSNSSILSRGGVRKLFNSLGTYLPAVALLWLAFVPDDDKVLSVCLLIVAVGISACCFSGFLINHIDLSTNHAGVLLGITNAVGNIFSTMAPLVVHAVVTDETDKTQWRTIFITATCVYVVTSTFYVAFASGETQPWNKTEEKDDTTTTTTTTTTNVDTKL